MKNREGLAQLARAGDLDPALAALHLDQAFRFRAGHEVLPELSAKTKKRYSADDVLTSLTNEASRRVLLAALEGDPARRVRHILERVERLIEVSAQGAILENAKDSLRASLASLREPGSLDGSIRSRIETVLR